MTSVRYPASTIWYLEASAPESLIVTYGSAVSVRLQEHKTKTIKTYLITCAHVLRGISRDGEKGVGNL